MRAELAAKLELAGELIPRLRNRRARRFKALRKEDFELYARTPNAPTPVVGETDSIDVALMVGLDELSVQPGYGTCESDGCGLVYELAPPFPGAKPPKTCPACRIEVRGECAEKCGKPATHGPHCWAHRQTVCAGWGGPCPMMATPGDHLTDPRQKRKAWSLVLIPSRVASRGGQPWRCLSCSVRKGNAGRTPEQRSDSVRKGHAALTPEQRSERGRKANAALTPEQRSESARKGNAARRERRRAAKKGKQR